MRILHWDEMFHPTFGYQINVLTKYQALQGHEIIIMTSENIEDHPTFSGFSNKINIQQEDLLFSQKYNIKIIRLPIHKVVSGRVIYKRGYMDRIKDEKPDILFCHTNDTFSGIQITRKFKKFNFPIVFDNHMLLMASTNPFSKVFRFLFRNFVTPIIIKNNFIVIRTQDDNYVNKYLGIPDRLTPFISFGSDTTIFKPNKTIRAEFRRNYSIKPDDFVIVYTGKLTEGKGTKLLASAIEKRFDTKREVVFIIVGNPNGQYGLETLNIMNKSENKIIHFSTQNYSDLPKFYQASDLCVFPKQCSLSFYDAQACGLPVILEENDVNISRLMKNNGFLYKNNDIDHLRNKIVEAVEMNLYEYNKMSNNAYNFVKNNYDYEKIAKEYTLILQNEYNKFHKK